MKMKNLKYNWALSSGFSESFWLHCASFSQGLALFFLPDASVWLQLLPHYYLHTILQAILGYCLVLQATNDDAFRNKNKHKAFKLSNQTHHLVNQVPFSTFWMDPCYLKESFWGGFHKLVFNRWKMHILVCCINQRTQRLSSILTKLLKR